MKKQDSQSNIFFFDRISLLRLLGWTKKLAVLGAQLSKEHFNNQA